MVHQPALGGVKHESRAFDFPMAFLSPCSSVGTISYSDTPLIVYPLCIELGHLQCITTAAVKAAALKVFCNVVMAIAVAAAAVVVVTIVVPASAAAVMAALNPAGAIRTALVE